MAMGTGRSSPRRSLAEPRCLADQRSRSMIIKAGPAQNRWSRHRTKRGQARVEFALVLPIFLLVLVALFDLGRAVFAYNTLTNAAREGVRLAIVNQDTASIIARAKSQTQIIELSDPSVDIDFWQVNDDGSLGTACAPAAVGCVA